MAWVEQEFSHKGFQVTLQDDGVWFDQWIHLLPKAQEEAHAWAMMLRKAARRLEEIGKGLS